MQFHGQNKEDEVIYNYFRDRAIVGKFVEIGAYHPFKFSNTRVLWENGWNGVYVEPSPVCVQRFYDEYLGDADTIKIMPVAVGPVSGMVDFFDANGDAIGTTDVAHKEKWERGNGVKYSKITVEMVAMEQFANAELPDCDFLCIDVEGKNHQLFEAIPTWVFARIEMLCIEHDGRNSEIEAKLSKFGFRTLAYNAENIIMAK